MTEMGWEVDEEVNQDKIGEADGMNLEVDSKDEVMHSRVKIYTVQQIAECKRRLFASQATTTRFDCIDLDRTAVRSFDPWTHVRYM